MGFWFALLMWVVSFVASDYFRAKLPSRDPSGRGDFTFPTSTEGRKVPIIVGGTARIEAPNVLWHGDWEAEAITVETGIIFKKDETVAYAYRIAACLGQFQGECAGVTAIYIGDDKVWDYVTDNSSVPGTVCDIDLPDLFGGEKEGGGFVARIRAFTGENSQAVSTYLSTRITNQSAWPGFTYLMMTNIAEDGPADIGEANQLRVIKVEWQAFSTVANGGLGDDLSLGNDHHFIGQDANPVSVAYKILTDEDFSLGLSNIDFISFKAAAEAVYTEGIGYSQVVDSEIEAPALLAELEKHIDGYIGENPVTGLFEIILARQDYTPASEFQATEANIIAVKDFSKAEWPQVKNEVKLRFADREKNYQDNHAVAQDMAGRLITNRPQSITIRFPGVRTGIVANAIVARTARTYFWPLSKCKLELDRTAYALRPGAVVMLTHPDAGNSVDVPFRVTRISLGTGNKQIIIADVVEDVFQAETGITSPPLPTEHIPPSADPVDVTVFAGIQSPRWILERNDIDLTVRMLFVAGRDTPNSRYHIQYRTRDDFGSGSYGTTYEEQGPSFQKFGTLRAALDQLQDSQNDGGGGAPTAEFAIDGNLSSLIGSYDIYGLVEGIFVINPGLPNEEFIAVQEITADGAGVLLADVIRGVGDTPIATHLIGSPVFLVDNSYVSPSIGLEPTDGWQFKMAGSAQGVTQDFGTLSFSAEQEVLDRNTAPIAPTTLAVSDLGSWQDFFSAGPWEAGPETGGGSPQIHSLRVRSRIGDPASLHPVVRSDGRDDDGVILPTNWASIYNPTANWYIYDLDLFPTPVRGDEAASGQVGGTLVDDREAIIDIGIAALRAMNPDGGSTNARIEITFQHGTLLNGILTGVEGRSLFVDRVITFTAAFDSIEAAKQTVFYLKGEELNGADQFIDWGPNAYTVSQVGTPLVDGATTTDTGLPLGCLALGGGNYLTLPNAAAQDLANSPGFMIQLRIQFLNGTPGRAGTKEILSKWPSPERVFFLGILNDDWLLNTSTNGTDTAGSFFTDSSFTTGVWYEMTCMVWNERFHFYEDGDYLGLSAETVGTLFAGDTPVVIGNWPTDDILIDEIRIVKLISEKTEYTVPTTEFLGRDGLVPLQMSFDRLADNQTTGNTEDLNRWQMTYGGTTDIDTIGPYADTQSLKCDGVRSDGEVPGTNDGVWLPGTANDPGNPRFDFHKRDFTMECFVRFDTLPSTTTDGHALITKFWRDGGPTPALEVYDGDWRFQFDGSDRLFFTHYAEASVGGATPQLLSSAQTMSINTWYHCAVVREGDALALFFDGDRIAYESDFFVTNPQPLTNRSNAPVAIGRNYRVSGAADARIAALDGWISEVRIKNCVAEYDTTQTTYTVPTVAFAKDAAPWVAPVPDQPDTLPSNWTPEQL